MHEPITEEIQRRLEAIEREEEVAICLAVESGSRAWGFASTDSDYDVRFLYVHRPEWYLSILEGRNDVIERPIADDLDFSGWDLRKALRLFRKSNPPLLEWLQCPIVYRERFSLAGRMRAMLPEVHGPRSSFHHYLHLARGNLREYLQGDLVWRKKYFYVLRPLLAMLWIEQGRGPVPIEFQRLVDATVTDPELLDSIAALIAEKSAGAELDRGLRIRPISDFIDAEMARLGAWSPEGGGDQAPAVERLDALFRETLTEVWGGSPGG